MLQFSCHWGVDRGSLRSHDRIVALAKTPVGPAGQSSTTRPSVGVPVNTKLYPNSAVHPDGTSVRVRTARFWRGSRITMLSFDRAAVYPDGLAKTRSLGAGPGGVQTLSTVSPSPCRSCPAGERNTGKSRRRVRRGRQEVGRSELRPVQHGQRSLLAGLIDDIRCGGVDGDRIHRDARGVVVCVAGQHRAGRRVDDLVQMR